jgi:hypothetical protein
VFVDLRIVVLFLFLVGFSQQLTGQDMLRRPVALKPGTYELIELLNELRSKGYPISFSPDKITDATIAIDKSVERLGQLLDQLQSEQLISYKVLSGQILIAPPDKVTYTFNGVIKNAKTGEQLIGASVGIKGTTSGSFSNGYGYYSITYEKGSYTIVFSHIGFETKEVILNLNQNQYLNISLDESSTKLDEVIVDRFSSNFNITSSIPSSLNIDINSQKNLIPYLGGEVDVIQNALLQPGIKSIGEDASGINIRGGAVDQNLNLLDEAVIYNPNHFFGLISIFNPESINRVRILKGYIPPSYGGRTSGVIEVRQKEGNTKKVSYSGGIGFPSARFLVEGPFREGKSSFLVSGRQSLFIPAINDFGNTSVRRNRYSFQDLNLKINSRPNLVNTYYLSGYLGNDRNTAGLSTVRNWGNKVANFRWNHIFTRKLFSNVSTYISEYSYRNENQEDPGAFVGESRIVDYSFKSDLLYNINPENEIDFGFNVVFHRLNPGVRRPFDPEAATTNSLELDREHAFESAIYVSQEADFNRFSLNYGLRYSLFHNIGSATVFVYNPELPLSDESIIDTLFFGKNQLVKFYDNLEPRFAVNYRLSESEAIKGFYTRSAQYLHLISNTISPAPTDIWKLSDTHIPPTVTDQYGIGYYKNFLDDKWEFNTEIYYKDIVNGIQYKSGADLVFNENIETELLLSRGRAYGIELYARKIAGKLTGWISYTLSRAESQLVENTGKDFVLENHDRLHDFSASWNYTLTKRMTLASNFVFRTGIPVTLPTDQYRFEDNLVPHFVERNDSRLPPYHRLDLSLHLYGRDKKKNGEVRKNKDYWVFTLYNIYARKNASAYFFRESEANPGQGEIVQYSVFGTIIPSVTYNFKF